VSIGIGIAQGRPGRVLHGWYVDSQPEWQRHTTGDAQNVGKYEMILNNKVLNAANIQKVLQANGIPQVTRYLSLPHNITTKV